MKSFHIYHDKSISQTFRRNRLFCSFIVTKPNCATKFGYQPVITVHIIILNKYM